MAKGISMEYIKVFDLSKRKWEIGETVKKETQMFFLFSAKKINKLHINITKEKNAYLIKSLLNVLYQETTFILAIFENIKYTCP